MKKLSVVLAFAIGTSATIFAQEKNQVNDDINFLEMIQTDIQLTPEQTDKVNNINRNLAMEIQNIAGEYTLDSEVYQNKVRLAVEQRDAQLNDVLTLEQYAVYLNNISKYQSYDAYYSDDDLEISKESDGDIEVETEEGDITINDRKMVIDNDKEDTKTKVKKGKVKYKDDDADYKKKIKDDKIVIKKDGKKEVVKDDEASKEKGDMEIEIED